MSRYLIHFIFALAALCHLGCAAAVLSATQLQYKPAGADLAILKDAAGTLAVEALEQADVAARFVPLNGPPKLGYSKEVVWLRLRLQRQEDAPQTWFLEFSNPFVNDLRLYSRSASGFAVAQAGDQFAFAERALKFSKPVFALEFPDTKPQTFYLRLDSDSTLAGELLVWQPDALRLKAQHQLFYAGLVLGMVCMSFLLSVIHWLHGRERKVLLFSILTVNTFFFVAIGMGVVAQFLTPTLPAIADLMVPWSLALTTVSIGVVIGNLLNIPVDFPRLNQFLKLAFCLALAAPVTRAFNLYSVWGGPLLQWVSLCVVCCTGWVSWLRWRSHNRGAAYYVAAHGVVIASFALGRLMLLGWLPSTIFAYISAVPSMLTFLLLVHAGVFVDSQSAQQERDAALAEIQTAQEVLLSERTLREEQTVFFSFVAHELRSPLAAILTGLKNLKNEWTEAPPAVRARTLKIKAYAERMAGLIDRHLTLQRLANADFLPHISEIQLRPFAEEVQQRMQALFEARLFEFDYAEGLPTVAWADQELLFMALDNVLTNAVKFSPEGSSIRLEVFADSALHFRVSDRGPGIHPEHIARLYAIYNRLQQKDFTGGVTGGFGIGLAIAQRVAQAHGGSLDYADRAGGGAVFTFSLPLKPASRASGASV